MMSSSPSYKKAASSSYRNMNMNMDNETNFTYVDKIPFQWNEKVDEIMIEWCDIARCYKWLHLRSYENYILFNMLYTIPIIVLSTVSGTASFAQESFPPSVRLYSPMIIGSVNILVGIITTLQKYFKIAELSESYKHSYISWDKFARNIQIEISKDPLQRNDAKTFFKHSRAEYDRLMEYSPPIPPFIVNSFIRIVSGTDGTPKREDFENLHKPEIFNTIESSNSYSWYKKDLWRKREKREVARSSITSIINNVIDKLRNRKIDIPETPRFRRNDSSYDIEQTGVASNEIITENLFGDYNAQPNISYIPNLETIPELDTSSTHTSPPNVPHIPIPPPPHTPTSRFASPLITYPTPQPFTPSTPRVLPTPRVFPIRRSIISPVSTPRTSITSNESIPPSVLIPPVTPVTTPAAPVPATTPVTTPVTATNTPVPAPAASVTAPAASVTAVEAPVPATNTPVTNTPVTNTPVTAADTPVTAADTPANTPVTAADTPVTAADTPANTPVTAADTPVTAADTPVTAADTPVTDTSIITTLDTTFTEK
jgi:hypothetical protein